MVQRRVSSFSLILSATDPLCQRDLGANKKKTCVGGVNMNTKFEGVTVLINSECALNVAA